MKPMLTRSVLALFLLATTTFAGDPLPSWNGTAQKKAMVNCRSSALT